jgi:hypothetical protein
MPKDTPTRANENALAREVDKLIKKLPYGAPVLPGASDAPARLAGSSAAAGAAVGAATQPQPNEPSELAQQVSAWLRALMAAGLAVGVLYWPYALGCGWGLYRYLGVLAAVMLAGGWAAVWAWRVRAATAHVISLIVIFWGIVLAAEQILPRIGYAAVELAWACTG